MGFPGDSDCKESTYNSGDLGSITRLGRSPGGGHGNPIQYSCLENSHRRGSLAGYNSWGRDHKELDTTHKYLLAFLSLLLFIPALQISPRYSSLGIGLLILDISTYELLLISIKYYLIQESLSQVQKKGLSLCKPIRNVAPWEGLKSLEINVQDWFYES